MSNKTFWIDYTNHRGERVWREIEPLLRPGLWFGSTPWHPEEQWMLGAYDHHKKVIRDFALNGIHAFSSTPPKQEAWSEDLRHQALMDATHITRFDVENGCLALEAQGGAASLLVEMLAKQYDDSDATNYIEVTFRSKLIRPDEEFVVTVQRKAGKTAAKAAAV